MHASDTGELAFEDFRVPADAVLGEVGKGFYHISWELQGERLVAAAGCYASAERMFEKTLEYAKEREAFGRKIIDHQGLGFLLADMAAAVVSARATYLDAARRRDAGRPYSTQASVAKLVATDAAMKVTTDMVQVLGGAGYVCDHPVERFFREAKVLQIVEGTNQIQRLVIGRSLAKD